MWSIIYMMVASCYAQNYNFANYNSKQGLPSSEVYCTVQDNNGYIWFGTDAGVCKFDGIKFTKYTTENGLTDNTVLYMHVDHKGKVWFGTFSGGICYYLDDSIYTISASDSLKKMIFYGMDYINCMYVDNNERLWLGLCTLGGIIYIDKKNNYRDIVHYQLDSAFKHILFVGNSQFPIYAGTSNSLLKQINIYAPGGIIKIPIPLFSGTSNRIRAFHSKNRVLIFSFYNYIYVIKNNQLAGKYKMPHFVVDIFVDPWDYIWISMYKNGIFRYSSDDLSISPEKYFDGLTVTDCMYDKERGLWITTIEKGVYYMPSTLIKRIEVEPSHDPNFTSITSYQDKVFISAGAGYIYEYTYDSIHNSFHFKKIVRKSDYYIHKVVMIKDEILSASNHLTASGLNFYDSKEIKIDNKNAVIKDTYVAEDKSILLAGLHFYAETDSNYQVTKWLIVPARAHAVIKTKKGDIYLGTANGVWELEQDSFKYLGDKNPLLKFRTDDILEDSYHNIWFITREVGVVLKVGENYYPINQEVGLVSNQCSGIIQDKNQNIWISTYEGLSQIYMRNGLPFKIENYTVYNGLNSNEVKSIYLYKDCILLINSEGVDFFKYNECLKNITPPPIFIESALVDDKKLSIDSTMQFFSYKSRIIEFSFSGLTFTSFGDKNYKYKLDGYDKNWHYTHNNSIRYTNLPAGKYTFFVYGVNNNGVISKVPASVSFVITLPWWKSSMFYVGIYTFSILSILILSITYTQSIKRKAKKASRIDYMLAESRLIALRAQMNPHFIFNVINSIQYYVLQNDKEKAYDYLARFSRLIRLVLDSSKYLKIPLSREIEILKYYTELEKLRFGEELQIAIEVKIKTSMDTIMIPNMIIQPYVENAIAHGLLPKKKNAKLNIYITEEEGFILVVVADNGIGRTKAAEYKRSSAYESSGMIITSERLRVLQTLSDVDVKVKIADLTDDNGNPMGTRVEITIPIKAT